MDKVVRNGKMAVLLTSPFGLGWSTYTDNEVNSKILATHPKLIQMVEDGRIAEITVDWVNKNLGLNLGEQDLGSGYNLVIEWVPLGSRFLIESYDGAESIRYVSDTWTPFEA